MVVDELARLGAQPAATHLRQLVLQLCYRAVTLLQALVCFIVYLLPLMLGHGSTFPAHSDLVSLKIRQTIFRQEFLQLREECLLKRHRTSCIRQ